MFRKRQKKIFPKGTFIPTPARICAIIQLCLAFIVLLWTLSTPFLHELFSLKSKALLYEEVMGLNNEKEQSEEALNKLERNRMRLSQLSEREQSKLIEGYEKIKEAKKTPFLIKTERAMRQLLYKTSRFKLCWIFFSILLPILLLKKREGALAALWILPLLTICYIIENQALGKTLSIQEKLLFPSEETLTHQYLDSPLSNKIFEQRGQLRQAWERYLSKEWASNASTHEEQVESGEYAFTLARIEKRELDERNNGSYFLYKEYPVILIFYLSWNLFFVMLTGISYFFQQSESMQEIYSRCMHLEHIQNL